MTLSGFITLVVVVMIAAVIYILLASMPGKTAKARAHPHADAINILGWIGLLLGIALTLVFTSGGGDENPTEAPAMPVAPDALPVLLGFLGGFIVLPLAGLTPVSAIGWLLIPISLAVVWVTCIRPRTPV